MRVLIVHELFPPEIVGGGELLMFNLATSLSERGVDVKVLTTGKKRSEKIRGIEVIRIPTERHMLNFLAPVIAKHARSTDVIQASTGSSCFPSWIAAKILKKPICCYVHHIFGDYWKDIRGPVTGRIAALAEKMFLTRSYDMVVFQNKSSFDIGMKIGIDRKKSLIITPGIDSKKFTPMRKENYVLFVGNLNMEKENCTVKGVRYLLEAAKILDDVKFKIVGSGKYLENMVRNAGDNVEFLGPLFGKDLRRVYGKALVFCLPSLNEGFGLSLLEAMASGCAIVSTIDIGEEGIIVEPKDTKALVKGIEEFVRNRKKAVKCGRKNRKIAKEFSWKRYVDRMIEIYESIAIK